MSDRFGNFPTLEQVNKSIARLKDKSWPEFCSNSNIEEFVKQIKEIIISEFGILPNIFKLFRPKEFALRIFRVRELDSFTNINLFSEHSYPPIALTRFGRCNFPNHPVFYCSNHPITALMEVVRENSYKNRKYCISSWGLIETEKEFVIQNFLHTELHENNYFEFIKKFEIEQVKSLLEGELDDYGKEGFIEYLDYLHSSFISDKNYSLSATLAHNAIYANHNLSTDILMYPSIQTQFKGVNMAIHPNFVDNMMQVQRLYLVELENYSHEIGKYKINVCQYANIEKNVCMWKNLDQNDEDYKDFFLKDFTHFLQPDFEFEFQEIKQKINELHLQ